MVTLNFNTVMRDLNTSAKCDLKVLDKLLHGPAHSYCPTLYRLTEDSFSKLVWNKNLKFMSVMHKQP